MIDLVEYFENVLETSEYLFNEVNQGAFENAEKNGDIEKGTERKVLVLLEKVQEQTKALMQAFMDGSLTLSSKKAQKT